MLAHPDYIVCDLENDFFQECNLYKLQMCEQDYAGSFFFFGSLKDIYWQKPTVSVWHHSYLSQTRSQYSCLSLNVFITDFINVAYKMVTRPKSDNTLLNL